MTIDPLRPALPRLLDALCVVTDVTPTELARLREPRALEVRATRVRVAGMRALELVVTDPQEAWELLAARGVIPDAWVEAPRRAVPCDDPAHFPRGDAAADAPPARCPRCDAALAELSVHPPTLAACLALAADPPGLAQAEALACEVASRLGLDGSGVYTRVAHRTAIEYYHRLAMTRWNRTAPERCSVAEDALAIQHLWLNRLRTGEDALGTRAYPHGLQARAWDCEEPLRELVATGYLIDEFTAGGPVLAVPVLEETR